MQSLEVACYRLPRVVIELTTQGEPTWSDLADFANRLKANITCCERYGVCPETCGARRALAELETRPKEVVQLFV